jgi:hypothetical protein
MPGLAPFARFLSALLLALLPAFPFQALADAGLRADKSEIAVGESTTLRLDGVTGMFKTRWKASPDNIVRFDNTGNSEAGVTALKPGRVSISAKVLASSYSLELKVLDAPDKKDPKGAWHTKIEGMAKGLGFPDKDTRIVRMLAEVNDGSRLPFEFYADLANIPATLFDVIKVRSKLVDGHPDFARDVLGHTFAAGGTPVEMNLLAWRRKQTLAAIDEVVKRFVDTGRVPKDGTSLIVSHVGKWATQELSALTFTGDIDFSFVSSTDVELAEAMKAAFADVIKRRTGLDPKSLDSVATAHGRAGLEVYIGRHGMAFAEEQLKINQLVDMNTGQKTDIEIQDVTKLLAKERSLAESAGKQPPKPVHDTEPGLSMEMVRHFGHDIVKPKIFDLTNAVVKAAKYLDRSYKSLEKAKGTPDDPKLAEFAKQMTEWANAKPQTAEIRDNMIKRISEFLGAEPKVVFDGDTQKLALALDPGQIAAFHQKATEAMWKTVEQGSTTRTQEMETRMRDLTERKRRGDNVDEEVAKLRGDMTSLVDMVEAEIKAFKGAEVPKVVSDNNAKVRALMNILAGRFGTKVLSEEELKDKKFVEELLKAEGDHGSEMRRQMSAAYIMERSIDALMKSPEIVATGAMSGVEKGNQMLDFIDDRLLGSIRGETGFSDFETEMKLIRQAALDPKNKAGVTKQLNALKSRVALGVKAANQKINQSLQATAAGRQGMKFMMVYGLADEMKSYRDAFDNEGWGGFATEIFRRRIPLGSAVEGAVMGNTYRAGWDVVTTLIPPFALPEAAWGLGTAIGTQAQSTYWSEQLALFVDTLYDSAKFQLEQVETHGGAKVGVYRLVSVKHRGIPIDLSQFAAMRKDQVDALRQQVGKGHLDWAKYDKEFQGLTRWTEVDTVLQKNIADSDPALALIEEMMKHEKVGPRLMDRLTEKGLVRWEEVKLGFITNLIKRLEDRKQADQALGAGMLPDLFLELRKAAAALEIEDAMLHALDAEVDTSNLKALVNWLWETKRNVLQQAPTESETTRAAQVVKKYLDTYQGILKSRDQLAASLPAVAARDGSTRYLTGDLFLSGRADADKASADAWVKHVGSSLTASGEALLAIKKEFLPNLALDAEDEKYLARVFPRELWMKPYKDAGVARGKTWLLDRAIAHGKERNAILDEYKAWLEKQAPVQLTVTVLDVLDGKKQVGGASGDLKPTDILGKPGTGKASGNQLVFGVPSGRYRLTIKAAGYDDASQDVLLGRALNPKPTLSVSLMPADRKGDGNLAQFIADALKARDWKRLADRLDGEKKSDLKMKNVVAWQANIDALGEALKTLRDERMDWALAGKEYLDALDNIDSSVWDKLTRQVESKRSEVERRCWDSSSPSLDAKKRSERCQTEGRKFEESCVGTWPDQHWEERKRIRMAQQELPDAVQTLHSAAYFTQRAWFEAVEKLTEKYKLPFPYPKPVTPRLKYALSCADVALPTGKKDPDALSAIKVTVEAPSASLPFGKSVTLNAGASGGKSPYRFAWSSGGSGARVSVTPRWAGEWTVTVSASDADGKSGEGSATLRVSAAQVKLQGVQPTVFYGGTATLSLPGKEAPPPPVAAPDPCAGRGYTASNPFDECIRIDPSKIKTVSTAPREPGVIVLDKPGADPDAAVKPAPSTGKQRVVWQAEPAVSFNPSTSADGKTQVTYDRMGSVKLWCEIQEEIEGAFHSVGECGQETVKVIAPRFSVVFTPPEGQGRIGQDIRAQVNSQPGVADMLIDFRWFDPPSSNRSELSSNAREIGFRLKDTKPLLLKALARVPYHGDEIAEINATYTAQVYQVKAWAEEPGTRPMLWDAKKGGLVPVPKGSYATHERIPLRAEIQGGAPDGVRWNWTVNEDSTISNPISQTPTVSRTSAGAISAHVEARDAEGAVLGSGDVSLSVIEVRDAPPAPGGLADKPTPALTPDKTTLERGESVAISAAVSGGKPPYTYAWQGATGQGARVTAKPANIGQHTVRLTVTDSKGKTGSTSLALEVQAGDRNKSEATRSGEQATKNAAAKPSQPVDLGTVGGKKGTPRSVNNVSIDDASWVRFKSTDEKRLSLNIPVATPTQAAAVAVVSNLDDATYLAQGKTIARITVLKDSGDETLDIQAGVHSSEWNYGTGPKHAWVKDAFIGGDRFLAVLPLKRPGLVRGLKIDYVETGAEKWSGHAPGFCLRGISLVENTQGITLTPSTGMPSSGKSSVDTPIQPTGPAANVAGKWKTSEGELTLNPSGNQVSGSYTSDGGEIVGTLRGNVLEGWWIENGSSERCAVAKNGRYHWGQIRWTFDGDKFAGVWSYCDKPLPGSGVGWTGERIGVTPSPGASGADGDWGVVETTPGMYRLEQSTGQVKIARQGNNPGGLQHAGLRLNRGLPASGDFEAQVSFSDARIEGGLNQIELHATFSDGAVFYVVRDREGGGSHIWAPGLQGSQPCGRAGTLRMERRGETVTGYCDGKAIWSTKRPAALTRLQFVLQNNGSNDPISATFRDWRFQAAAGTTAGSLANLARGKPASQSSRSQWSRPDDPQGAVDGVINGSYSFHTNNEANPWWQVDLGASYRLSEVRLYNRLDCCGERARTLQVMLSDDGRNWRTVYRHNGAIFGGKDGKPLVVSLSGEPARHVRLQLNESNWFHLDEVEVMGVGNATPGEGGRDYTGYAR